MKRRRTWKQKIGKRLLQHVKETTQDGTLRSVRANAAQDIICWDCRRILELTAKVIK